MKNTIQLFILSIAFLFCAQLSAQTEIDLINTALLDYIEGTATGDQDRVRDAFHEDLKLYHISSDTLVTWSGTNYVDNITPGQKSNRIGRVVSMDYENNAAMAKIEIDMPGRKRIYTDYLLLLKIEKQWKIIHKSFTYVNYPE